LYGLMSRVGTKSINNNDQIKMEIMTIEMAYTSASRQAKRVVQGETVTTTPIVVVPEVKISR